MLFLMTRILDFYIIFPLSEHHGNILWGKIMNSMSQPMTIQTTESLGGKKKNQSFQSTLWRSISCRSRLTVILTGATRGQWESRERLTDVNIGRLSGLKYKLVCHFKLVAFLKRELVGFSVVRYKQVRNHDLTRGPVPIQYNLGA